MGAGVGTRVAVGLGVNVGTGVFVDGTEVSVGVTVAVGMAGANELHANDVVIKTKITSKTGLKRFFFISLLLIEFRGNKFPRFQNNITMRIIFPET